MDGRQEQGSSRRVLEGRSANHFELAFTNDEFLFDFGQAYDPGQEASIHTRIIMTPRSAATFSKMLVDLVDKYKQQLAKPQRGKE